MDVSIPIRRIVAWTERKTPERSCTSLNDWMTCESGAPDVSSIEPLMRRRLSPMARGMLHCALRCQQAVPLRMVFASRYGDEQRSLEILDALAAGEGVSPTAFTLSVHNAPASILSIHQRNQAPINALAAGEETFGWGLVDAYSTWVQEADKPLLFVYGDAPLPEVLAEFSEAGAEAHAMAFLLAHDAPRTLSMRWEALATPTEPLRPQSLTLLDHLLGETPEALWRGARRQWSWHVV